jgi:hypothetical protein
LGEARKKEKLESELEIARLVQNRLFPRTVPKLRSLELAGICIPGRYVSGDYYDFVRLDSRWTAIALADVSGKGVSAALLMASIQSALHAHLKFHSGATSPVLSTAALMELVSQQLYENTPPEKYATFFCSVYDDETGRLTYTNAGHLKPILVRGGNASGLEGDGMVAGLLPNVKYEQQEIQLEHRFRQTPSVRIVLAAGTHSPWVSRLLESQGHEVIVANARKVRLIYESDRKNDRAALGRLVDSFIQEPRNRTCAVIPVWRRVSLAA